MCPELDGGMPLLSLPLRDPRSGFGETLFAPVVVVIAVIIVVACISKAIPISAQYMSVPHRASNADTPSVVIGQLSKMSC